MLPADWAWVALAAGVLAYDATCPTGETLSEGMTRYHRARPWLTRIAVGYIVGHLLDWLPEPVDVLHHATRIKHVRRAAAVG